MPIPFPYAIWWLESTGQTKPLQMPPGLYENPRFSPDGKRIAYERGNDPEVGKFQFLLANFDGTEEKMIAGGPMSGARVNWAWSPDGKHIVSSNSTGGQGSMQVSR